MNLLSSPLKIMVRLSLGLLFGLVSYVGMAQEYIQNDPVRRDLTILQQQGQMVSVKLVVGKAIEVYVVGNKQADIDLQTLDLVIKQFNEQSGERELHYKKEGDHFTITDPISVDKPSMIDVTTDVNGKKETLHFKIKSKPKN